MGNVELIEKLGRNDPCPCGSGKRFKRCCLKGGSYDGSVRDYYFQGAPVIRRSFSVWRARESAADRRSRRQTISTSSSVGLLSRLISQSSQTTSKGQDDTTQIVSISDSSTT